MFPRKRALAPTARAGGISTAPRSGRLQKTGDTVEEAFDNAREIIDDPAEKINITVPALTLKRIDEYAMKHGESRSRFLVRAAEESMRKAG